MKGIYYNYDLEECNWMFKHGVHPIGCGTHDKTGNTFIIFMLTKQYRQLKRNIEKKYKQNNKPKLYPR